MQNVTAIRPARGSAVISENSWAVHNTPPPLHGRELTVQWWPQPSELCFWIQMADTGYPRLEQGYWILGFRM